MPLSLPPVNGRADLDALDERIQTLVNLEQRQADIDATLESIKRADKKGGD